MSVLLVLTLVYIAILVVALAAGLIAILYFLNGARSNLKQIAGGLKQVDQNVEPLKSALSAANDGLGAILRDLRTTGRHLAPLDAQSEEKRVGGVSR